MNFSITHPPGSWSWEQVKKIKNENWIFICKQILFLNVQSTILFALDSDDIVYMHASVATLKASCFSVSQWMTTHHRRLSYTPLYHIWKNLDWANLKQQLSIFIYKALLQRLPADLRSLIEFKHSTYLVRSRDILTSPFCWFHTELGKNWCKILCCLDMKQA